jgi:hypothetical protein
MSTQPQSPDFLDELFTARSIEPRGDFVSETLGRIKLEAQYSEELDDLVDTHLGVMPIEPDANFADRVQRALKAEKEEPDRKILGFPSWVVALGSIAALFVAGVIAFGSMIRQASEVYNRVPQGSSTLIASATALPEESVVAVASAAAPNGASVLEHPDLEELLLMEAALRDVAMITDSHGWQTLALLSAY